MQVRYILTQCVPGVDEPTIIVLSRRLSFSSPAFRSRPVLLNCGAAMTRLFKSTSNLGASLPLSKEPPRFRNREYARKCCAIWWPGSYIAHRHGGQAGMADDPQGFGLPTVHPSVGCVRSRFVDLRILGTGGPCSSNARQDHSSPEERLPAVRSPKCGTSNTR